MREEKELLQREVNIQASSGLITTGVVSKLKLTRDGCKTDSSLDS